LYLYSNRVPKVELTSKVFYFCFQSHQTKIHSHMDPLKVFVIYSHEDVEAREDLVKFLHHLENKGKINIWTDKEILPGELWDSSIKLNLNGADIILPLVSVDFYNSNYIRDVEFKTAKERLDRGEALLIPIIVKQCPWKKYEMIGDLQVLPSNAIPVDQWDFKNNAYTHIAEQIEEMADKLRLTRMEAEKLLIRKESEAKLKEEAQKTAEARKAREEAIKKRQEAQEIAEMEKKARLKAQEETKTERKESLRLKEAIGVIEEQKMKTRYYVAGIAALCIISSYYAFANFQNLRNRNAEFETMTAETGEYRATKQAKQDSIANLLKDVGKLQKEKSDLIIGIFQQALEMYKADAQRYGGQDGKKHMLRAKKFVEGLGFFCKDDAYYLEKIIEKPGDAEKL